MFGMNQGQLNSIQIMNFLNQNQMMKVMVYNLIQNPMMLNMMTNILNSLTYNPMIMNDIKNMMNLDLNMMNMNNMIMPNLNMNNMMMNNKMKDNTICLRFYKINSEGHTELNSVECSLEDKISDVIQKYREKSNDNEDNLKFIFNSRRLNPSITVNEAGLNNNSLIFISESKRIMGG